MKKKMNSFFLVFLLSLFVSGSVQAATIHVPADQSTIQAGINVAVDGDTVMVAPGTYVENIDFLGKDITLQSEAGAETTVIDGNRAGVVVTFSGGETEALLDGFTITNGYTNGYGFGAGVFCDSPSSPTITNCVITGNETDDRGAGVFCWFAATPTIRECVIQNNSARRFGGGVYSYYHSAGGGAIIEHCMISGNSATSSEGRGGGIYSYYSAPIITDCTITDNTAQDQGGGIYSEYILSPIINGCTIMRNTAVYNGGGICSRNYPRVSNCVISENEAGSGGGVYSQNGVPRITNCIIASNVVAQYGGGVCSDNSASVIINCTISGNTAPYYGGGVYTKNSSPTITNCVVWGNSANYTPEIGYAEPAAPQVTFSDVRNGWFGTGNIDADPIFVGGGDYHLGAGSPCIDTGTDAGVYTDIDGDERPQGAGFDMGSDEYQCPDTDGDGYLNANCGGDDCNDSDPAIHPGADEVCDGQDNDCSPETQDGVSDPWLNMPCDGMDWDFCEEGVYRCEPFGLLVCSDNTDSIVEVCDSGLDDDCDGFTDQADPDCWECLTPEECDDGNPCTDDDCVGGFCSHMNNTGFCDDGDECTMDDTCSEGMCSGVLLDEDGDNYAGIACGGDDCDDANPEVNPGHTEVCQDGVDNNCDGQVDEGCPPCFLGMVI